MIEGRPIPYALSQWDSGTEVFYRCPKCGCDFRLLGSRIKFCYECGEKINWQDCIKYAPKQIKQEYDDLVYNQHAYTQGDRPQDKALIQLLYKIYKNQVD